MEKSVIDELKQVTNIFEAREKEYLNGEIAENLTTESQKKLFKVIQQVLKDEVAFLLEIEIRRQNVQSASISSKSSLTLH